MDRTGSDNAVFEQVLQASPRPCLLTGPAGAGKTAVALALAEHYRSETGRGGCCLLAPNAATACDLRRRLLDRSPAGVILSAPVMTFRSLAERILAALSPAENPPRQIDPLRRHLLLQRLVAELAEQGELQAFAPVADAPGLVGSLARSISELKRSAADPNDLDRAFASARGKTHDLLAVYRGYQQHLQAGNLYDAEGLMWQTRDALRALPPEAPSPLPGVRAIVVDAFTDFTPTQLQILADLARHVDALLITLPHDADGRDRMWQWTRRTRDSILAAFDPSPVELPLRRPSQPAGPLRLAERTFTYRGETPDLPDGIDVIEAPAIEAEVAAVARRVKRLLVDGATAGQIAVLARSQQVYRETIERVFADHDIPIAPAGEPLAALPPVKFLLNLAALPDANFAAADVLTLIKSSYFLPAAFEATAETLAVAEMLIREGNVYAGRESYARAATRLASRCGRQARDPEDEDAAALTLGPLAVTAERLDEAAAMLEKLFALFDVADESPRDALLRLAEAAGLREAILRESDGLRLARDLRGLEMLRRLLETCDHWPAERAAMPHALAEATLPAPRSESVVDVLSVLDARGLRWRHVFLLGCSEGQFPQSFGESALLSEADRRRWIARGVNLDCRSDLTAREMLLFYLALSRADATLTCSFLSADAGGEACGPGAFLETCFEPFGGLAGLAEAGRIEAIPVGMALPQEAALASQRDALSAAMAGQFSDEHPPHPAALAWACEHAPQTLRRAAMGLWAARRRWSPNPCDAFDGRLSDPALLMDLAKTFGHGTELSASQFNTFGQCGWHYFGRYVCHLEPLAAPQRRLEPVGRGLFMHNLLYRVYRLLAADHGLPVRLWQLDPPAILAALEEAFAEETRRIEAAVLPYPVLWNLQRQQLRNAAEAYLLSEHADPLGLRAESLHFELSFGAGRDDDLLDPASREAPVTLETSAGELNLIGKIDRLDRVSFGGRTGLLVVDYKTGQLPKTQDALDGKNLQMPLYVQAVGQLLGTDEPCFGGAYHAVNADAKHEFFARMQRCGSELKDNPAFEEQQATAMAKVAQHLTAMRSGQFDLLPHPEKIRYDDYREIDHYSPARAEIKPTAEEQS
jgi:ATP-dependent helicase/DNAse subunit B